MNKSKQGKNNRRKGHQLERDVANTFKSKYPKAKRALEYQEGLGYDITNTGSLYIQCKRSKGSIPMKHLDDVETPESGIPLLVSKKDREKTKVTLYLDDFMRIINEPDCLNKFLNYEHSIGLDIARKQ